MPSDDLSNLAKDERKRAREARKRHAAKKSKLGRRTFEAPQPWRCDVVSPPTIAQSGLTLDLCP